MELEKRGIPTVAVLSHLFAPIGRSIAEGLGLPSLRIATVEHPLGAPSIEGVERKADAAMGSILEALALPTSAAAGTLADDRPSSDLVEIPDDPVEAIEFAYSAG